MTRLTLLLLVVSCGDTGPDVSRETLDELGRAGYDRLCAEARQQLYDMYASSLMTQFICTADAVATTSNASDCAAATEVCLATPPASAVALLDQVLGQAGCSAVSIEPSGCDEPVSRLTSCLDALESEVDRLQFTGTCAAAGQPVDNDWWQFELPSACVSVDGDC